MLTFYVAKVGGIIDYPQPIGKVVWLFRSRSGYPQLKVTHNDKEYFKFVKDLITIHKIKVPINKFHFDKKLFPESYLSSARSADGKTFFEELMGLDPGAHDVAADFEKRLLMELMKILKISEAPEESAGSHAPPLPPPLPPPLKMGEGFMLMAMMTTGSAESYLKKMVKAHCEEPGGYQKERLLKLMKGMGMAEGDSQTKVGELLVNLQQPYEPPVLVDSYDRGGFGRCLQLFCCPFSCSSIGRADPSTSALSL